MYKALELIQEISQIKGSGSATKKKELCKINRDILKPYLDIAINPFRIFGIQKKHKPDPNYTPDMDFLEYCNMLESYPKTNINFQRLASVIETYPLGYQETLWKIVTKKLKIGVGVKTLNKVGYEIPVFECLLAESNKELSVGGIEFPCYMQPKFDGVRVIRFPDGTIRGRDGLECSNVKVKEHFQNINTNLVIDAEFFHLEEIFDDVISIYSTHNKEVPEGYQLFIFNAFTEEEWNSQKIDCTYEEVLNRIQEIEDNNSNYVTNAQNLGLMVENEESVKDSLETMIMSGHEGAILRGNKIAYKWERSKRKDGVIIKLKKQDQADCEITGFVEGTGKLEGTLGALLLDYKGKELKCGSGLTDNLRDMIWNNKEEYLSRWCKVDFMEETKDGSLRFPIFKGIRDSK